MKHGIVRLLPTLLCCVLLSGCAKPSAPSAAENSIPFGEGQVYALAYLGYQTPERLDEFQEKYLDGAAAPVHYVSGGDYYLVLPRGDVRAVRLYVNDIETDSSTLFYEQSDARPFVVQCNVSDIFPDLTVELVCADETVRFSPFVSLENGEVLPGERGLLLSE